MAAEEQAEQKTEEDVLEVQQIASQDSQRDAKPESVDSEQHQADEIIQEVALLSGAIQSNTSLDDAEVSVNSKATDDSEVADSSDDDLVPGATGESKKPVVLAVDDSPTVRKLVALTLTRAGFEVIEAEDGVEALNILASTRPNIVLSDINMPKLNGYKLCKFVKKHERTSDIPVVMLSGKDGVFDKMRGKLCGCDDFLSKPFEASALVAKVREHISTGVNA